MNGKGKCALLALAALALAAQQASAADSASAEVGTGNRSQIYRVGAQWDWGQSWMEADGSHLGGYWDLTGAGWENNAYEDKPGQVQRLADVGITPVFRWEADSKRGGYVEGGVGAHLMSHIYDNNGRPFSTAFQFGDHLGVGYVFSSGWEAGFKLQHFSNGAIKHPNPGANLMVFKVGFHF